MVPSQKQQKPGGYHQSSGFGQGNRRLGIQIQRLGSSVALGRRACCVEIEEYGNPKGGGIVQGEAVGAQGPLGDEVGDEKTESVLGSYPCLIAIGHSCLAVCPSRDPDAALPDANPYASTHPNTNAKSTSAHLPTSRGHLLRRGQKLLRRIQDCSGALLL